MNKAKVNQIFEKFSGQSSECGQMFIADACRNVPSMLKQGTEDSTQAAYLAAAVAYLDYLKIKLQIKKQIGEEFSIAGAGTKTETEIIFAEKLLNSFKEAFNEIIKAEGDM